MTGIDPGNPRARRETGRRPRAIQFGLATVVAVIALAVSLQAQRVSGQDRIEELHSSTLEATRDSAELRATVAAAESPAEVLAAAAADGMVQPAAVVAIPAAGPDDPADASLHEVPEQGAARPLG